jgi:hypothetical protein
MLIVGCLHLKCIPAFRPEEWKLGDLRIYSVLSKRVRKYIPFILRVSNAFVRFHIHYRQFINTLLQCSHSLIDDTTISNVRNT